MNSRKLIEHISRSDQRIEILRALRRRPGTPSELAGRVSVERTPVYTALEPLEQWGAVVSLGGRRKLTAAGDIAIGGTITSCNNIGRSSIAYLASSTGNKRFKLLNGLYHSFQVGEMAHSESFPSRSTINRALEDFEAFNWITGRPSRELTQEGVKVYQEYSELSNIINIVSEKVAYLRHVDPSKVTIPVNLIADAEIIQSRPNRPQRADEHTRERIREGFSHAKLISSYYSEAEVNEMFKMVERGATWEALTPLPSHIPLPDSKAEIRHFRMGLGTDTVEWQIYPDELPLDLIIFDDNRVLLGSDQTLESTRRDAVLDSTNPDLVAWANDLYDSHKAEASSPLDHLLGPIRENGLYRTLRSDLA